MEVKTIREKMYRLYNANRELQLKPPPKTINKEEDHKPTCYICLDDGPDELGGEVMRDCSCRGSAGYVHLSCAIKYAEQKYESSRILKAKKQNPWKECPNCHQVYTGTLAIDMAKQYVTFVEENYQRNHTLILSALVTRLESLTTLVNKRSSTQTEEAELVANTILHKVRQMKLKRIALNRHDRIYEAYAYEILGCMKSNELKFPEAIEFLEKSLQVCKDHNLSTVDRIEGMITSLKFNLVVNPSSEDILKNHKNMYEQLIRFESKSSISAIRAGEDYGRTLKVHNHGVEAEWFLTKLAEISHSNHGPEHEITQNVSSLKHHCMDRVVSVTSSEAGIHQSSRALSFVEYVDDETMFYRFLKYDGNFERCLVEGPLICSGSTTNKQMSLLSDEIIFARGTPVICQDTNTNIDGQLGDVRSWNSESKCYTIHWEDESLEPCELHQTKVRVPKCICDECRHTNPFSCNFEVSLHCEA